MRKQKINKKDTKLDPKNFIDGYLAEVNRCLASLDKEKIELVIDVLVAAYKKDRKVFILGNGGSASTASHMACDLGKGTLQRVYDYTERRLKVISLTDNVALMTAFANDLSFEDIFVQQLRNLVETGDLVIALSGSGNSKNVIKAVLYAKKIGAKTIGMAGFGTGGKLAEIVDIALIVESNHYGPIEDIHLILGHLIAACVASIKHAEYKNGKVRKNRAVPFYLD